MKVQNISLNEFLISKIHNVKKLENKNDIEIRFLRTQIYCLIPALTQQKDCLRTFDFKRKNLFKKQFQNINSADYIILRSQWSKKDINSIKQIAKYFKKNKKKLIIVSSSPEFNFTDTKFKIAEIDIKDILYFNFFNKSSHIDKFILKNNRVPNNQERIEIGKEYYSKLNHDRINLDASLEIISAKQKIDFFSFFELLCSKENQECNIMTNNDVKIFSDDKGHITYTGSDYLSSKFQERSFINLIN